jgi:hypothetical protein
MGVITVASDDEKYDRALRKQARRRKQLAQYRRNQRITRLMEFGINPNTEMVPSPTTYSEWFNQTFGYPEKKTRKAKRDDWEHVEPNFDDRFQLEPDPC